MVEAYSQHCTDVCPDLFRKYLKNSVSITSFLAEIRIGDITEMNLEYYLHDRAVHVWCSNKVGIVGLLAACTRMV